MNDAATTLPIVERSEHDLTLEDAADLAGRSPKTLRRAVHSGDLPRRYILGPRGPQLVFDETALRMWLASRMPAGRRSEGPDESPRRAATGDLARLAATVAQLHHALEDNRSTLAQLAARLHEQDETVAQTQATIAHLTRKLAEGGTASEP